MPVHDLSEADTAEHRPITDDDDVAVEHTPLSSLVRIDFGALSDRGKKRSNNKTAFWWRAAAGRWNPY